MVQRDKNATKLVNEYIDIQVKYQSFSELVGGIVGRLAKKVDRKYQMVSCRAKAVDRLYEKIERKKRDENKVYKKLEEVEDLAGARIIFYLERDRKAFIKDLNDELGEDAILRVEEQSKPNGYRATHVIIALDDTRLNLPEYSEYKGLKCELQITSSLFHAWSEIEHDITYKPSGGTIGLKELGLERLRAKFKELHKHIQGAAIQLDLIYEDYEQMRQFGNLLEMELSKEVKASSNDKIIEMFGLMENFADKKPAEILETLLTVFEKEPSDPEVLGMIGDHAIKGKTHDAVESAALELLDRIRYYKVEEILILLAKLIRNRDGAIKTQAIQVLEKIAGYNYHFITQVRTYYPQQAVLKFIDKWTPREQIDNVDFVVTAYKELLSTDIEGSEWTSEDTITFHSGVVPVSKGLEEIRNKVINQIRSLYRHTRRTDIRLKIIGPLSEATRTPNSVVDEKVRDMVRSDAYKILSAYQELIYSSDGRRLIGPLAVVEKIESRLYWWPEWDLGGDEAVEFRNRIINDPFYRIARILVGNSRIYQREEKKKGEDTQGDNIESLVESVTNSSFDRWLDILEKIAKERQYIDEWQFLEFKNFISVLSRKKSNIADRLTSRALSNNLSLLFFSDSFVSGFRSVGRLDLCDKYAEKSIRKKDINLVNAVVRSMYSSVPDDSKTKLRTKDITYLSNVVNHNNGFDFIKEKATIQFKINLFDVLCHVYKQNSRRIEPLIRKQIDLNSDLFGYYTDQLGFAAHRGDLDIQKFSITTKNLIKQALVKIRSLEWRGQELLLELGKTDLDLIFDVIVSRIRHEEKLKENRSAYDALEEKYDAVPFQLNPELGEFISGHPEFPEKALVLLGNMTKEWSLYNWDITHLFERMGAAGYVTIVKRALQEGGEKNILNAARCLGATNNADIDLCMQVIGMSDSKKVKGMIDQAILSTGVVSGEYGLSNAYQSKANALKPYLRKKNNRIKAYAKSTIKALESMATREKERSDEDRVERKLRFDHGR